MKKMFAVAAMCLLLTPLAKAAMPLTIGAESAGYGASVADQGDLFTSFWAGIRARQVSDHSAIYTCYQHVGKNGGQGGDGAKIVLMSNSETLKWLYLVADLGVASRLAKDAEGTFDAALTTGGGLAIALTEHISPFIYASAYDMGERFSWSVHAGLAIRDIQKLAGLKL